MTAANLIKRQVLDINLTSEQGSFLLQKQLSALYHQQLVPVIDALLTGSADDEKTIIIEKLEIDLGDIDPDNLSRDFVNRTQEELASALADMLKRNNTNVVRRQNQQQRTRSLIEYYLLHGSLPWWGQRESLRELFRAQITQQPAALVTSIRPLLDQYSNVAQRLVNLLPESDRHAVAALLQGCSIAEAERRFRLLVQQLRQLNDSPAIGVKTLSVSWLQYLAKGHTEGQQSSTGFDHHKAAEFRDQLQKADTRAISMQALVEACVEQLNTTPTGQTLAQDLAIKGNLQRGPVKEGAQPKTDSASTPTDASADPDVAESKQQQLTEIECLLSQQTLTTLQEADLHHRLTYLCQSHSETTKRWLLPLLKSEDSATLAQLLRLFDDQQIADWLCCLPGMASAGAVYKALLARLPLPKVPDDTSRLAVWTLLLEQLQQADTRAISMQALVEACVQQLNTTQTGQALAQGLAIKANSQRGPIKEGAQPQTDSASIPTDVSVDPDVAESIPQQLTEIERLLSQQALTTMQEADLHHRLTYLCQSHSETAKRWLLPLLKNKDSATLAQLLRLFDDRQIADWLCCLPGMRSVVVTYQTLLDKLLLHAASDESSRLTAWRQVLNQFQQTDIAVGALPRVISSHEQQLNTGAAQQTPIRRTTDNRVQQEKHRTVDAEAKTAEVLSLSLFTEQANEFYIDNSGLILFWPFLQAFFERLGLLQHKQLQQPEEAVVLLHYLVSASVPKSEHDLLLNKLLCGLPLTQVVEFDTPLKAQQQQAIDELLAAAIGHWAPLRKVSADWLRQVFLTRAGVIKRSDGCWLLQIENAAPDILLKQLPWSIGTVSLPWMDTHLSVEWHY